MTLRRSIPTSSFIAGCAALCAILSPATLHASPEGEALGRCLADNTTGKDRKDLARWVFVSMAAHPEIKPLAAVPPTAADEAARDIARLFTSVLVERCPAQARSALRGGSNGFEAAFGTLGQLAMTELMTDPDVNATLGAFERHLDRDKLATLKE
jgi:hypothetical protein